MENIERPAEVTKAQAQVMTEKNQQKYDQDQFEKIYDYLDELNGEASGNVKQVAVTQVQTTGTEIAKINIDGTETSLYTPPVAAPQFAITSVYKQCRANANSGTNNFTATATNNGYKALGIVGSSQTTAELGYDVWITAPANNSVTVNFRVINNQANTLTAYVTAYILWIKI